MLIVRYRFVCCSNLDLLPRNLQNWLVVQPPLWKIRVRQLGWLDIPNKNGKMPKMATSHHQPAILWCLAQTWICLEGTLQKFQKISHRFPQTWIFRDLSHRQRIDLSLQPVVEVPMWPAPSLAPTRSYAPAIRSSPHGVVGVNKNGGCPKNWVMTQKGGFIRKEHNPFWMFFHFMIWGLSGGFNLHLVWFGDVS